MKEKEYSEMIKELDLQEQLQEDLLMLTDEYLINELGEEYADFEEKMCEMVVFACKHYKLKK